MTMLKEINGAIELIVPARISDSAASLIDNQERARLQQWIHEPILGPDKGVAVFLEVESLKEQQRDFAPSLYHTAQIRGPAQIDARIERQVQD